MRRFAFLISCCLVTGIWADAAGTGSAATGFKNDGTGYFDDCTPPTTWDEGTKKNLVWKRPMPSWTASSPVVINDKHVVTLAEPNLVVCLSIQNGDVLWKTEIDNLVALNEKQRAAAKALYDKWNRRYTETLAIAAELKVLQDRLLCIGDKPEKAFSGNFMLNQIQPALKKGARAEFEKLSKDEIAAIEARISELKEKTVRGMATPSTGIIWPKGEDRKEWDAARAELAKYGYQFETWYGHMGHTFATPVTDGKRIYVSMGWGQVAALSIAGDVLWLKTRELKPNPELRFTNSPILVDGKLVVIAGGAIRAFDSKDGKILWSHQCPRPRVSMGQDQSGSPMELTLGGKAYVVTSHGRIYRAADGVIMTEKLPHLVASPVVAGDLIVIARGGVHGTTGKVKAEALRARLDEAGEKITLMPIWQAPLGGRAGMWTGPALHDGILYYGYPQNVLSLDLMTGKLVKNYVPNKFGYGSSHATNPSVAGGYYFTGNCYGQTLAVKAGPDGEAVALNQLHSELYRDHALEPVEILRRKWWNRGLFPTWGFSQSTPAFAGNRIFIRTYEALYCIGAE